MIFVPAFESIPTEQNIWFSNLFVNKSDLTSDDTVMCHGFSIAAYERRQLGLRVAVEKASFPWSRFIEDSGHFYDENLSLQLYFVREG